MINTATRPTSTTALAIRVVDASAAMLMILLSSPLLAYAMLRSTISHIHTFESVFVCGPNNSVIALQQLTYDGRYKSLPMLFNLLNGDISLLGSKIKFACDATQARSQTADKYAAKPGLISIEQINSATGLSFEAAQHSLNKAHNSLPSYIAALVRALFVFIITRTFMPKIKRTHQATSVFGVELDNWTMAELLNDFQQACQNPEPQSMKQYCFVNADCLNISTQNEVYLQCLQQSARVFADGIGVRLACLSKGHGLKDNLNGTDMFPRLCQLAVEQHLSIFLLGGEEGVATTVATNMIKSYPNLKIAGTHSGYFNTTNSNGNNDADKGHGCRENDAVVNQINQAQADILLVAMGAPLQEQWLKDNQHQLNCHVGIGVGGLFDFYSNRIKRAPAWLRQMGMEWSYRLLQEPRRMWQRYIIGNPTFLLRVWRENRQLKKMQSAQPQKQKPRTNINDTPKFNAKQANARRAAHNLHRHLNRAAKRILDISVSATLLTLLMPLFVLISLLIRIESKGAVLFCQPRAGRNNQPFTMWKFRSMYQDAEQRLAMVKTENEMQGGVLFKIKRDPRITLFGRFIRKASIDELPQLWNVLKGDMSLVGPRPALLSEVKQYSQHDRNRLMVKPGITCIWQVSGRSNIPFDKQVELDIDYIYQQSIAADIWLLLKTIPAVLFARGAY
ncbi:WecB/TagA/CpsF family glycosyltransferase [Shewanella sp. KX20019]|uniref:WecB/TagA/CpsF family glycosyltransferase n=1 Tax=Shewanella sp. KX20019 TaxID=2803864 RepID=UPI001926872E|nr:WecB/TagA/CpsF family glycosyltransferase [Shewanella sp. KX20019]QQX81830.1 WecB/TagA/CpsF family glycosyltransferase [Shewanella sp. KX20019]